MPHNDTVHAPKKQHWNMQERTRTHTHTHTRARMRKPTKNMQHLRTNTNEKSQNTQTHQVQCVCIQNVTARPHKEATTMHTLQSQHRNAPILWTENTNLNKHKQTDNTKMAGFESLTCCNLLHLLELHPGSQGTSRCAERKYKQARTHAQAHAHMIISNSSPGGAGLSKNWEKWYCEKTVNWRPITAQITRTLTHTHTHSPTPTPTQPMHNQCIKGVRWQHIILPTNHQPENSKVQTPMIDRHRISSRNEEFHGLSHHNSILPLCCCSLQIEINTYRNLWQWNTQRRCLSKGNEFSSKTTCSPRWWSGGAYACVRIASVSMAN